MSLNKSPFQLATEVGKFYAENEDGGAKAKKFLEDFDFVLNGIRPRRKETEDVAKN